MENSHISNASRANTTGAAGRIAVDFYSFLAVSLITIGFAVLVSNALVCALFCRFRALRTITNTFIVSLALSDVMVAVVFLPTYLAGLPISPYIIAYILFAYLFNFCGITWDRFQAVLNPLSYRAKVTRAVVYKILTLVWTIPVLFAIIPIFWEYKADIKTLAGRIYQGVLITIVTVCTVSICCAYARIFRATRRQVKMMIEMAGTNFRLESNLDSQVQGQLRRISKKLSMNISVEVKAAKVFALVGGTFAVCWLPLIVINVFGALGFPEKIPVVLLDISLYSLVGNALADPLIYSFYKTDYRRALTRTFCCAGKKRGILYGSSRATATSIANKDSTFFEESC